MRLWLRLDEELLGATDDAGCYHRPEALDVVLGWYAESVRLWLEGVAGAPATLHDGEVNRIARRMLRAIGSGRADARSEMDDERAERRSQRAGGAGGGAE